VSPATTAWDLTAPVHLLRGEDPSLVRDAVRALVDALVGDGDAGLLVEDLDGDYELGALVDAAQTPPFLSDRRIVIGRDAGRFSSAEAVAPLVAYLKDPLPTTALILCWETGRVPKALLDAVKSVRGAHVDTGTGRSAREHGQWLDDQAALADVKLDKAARELLLQHLGDELSRAGSMFTTLVATYGPGARLGVEEVTPFLGEEGGVAPWALTDAIDRGEIPEAIGVLHRTLGVDRHPLQVMGTLTAHYTRMLRLDGADVRTNKDAMQLLGMSSEFPARKVREQAQRLGSTKVARAIELLAEADLDLKGARALPGELVMEVLVARLAQLSRR